MLSGCTRGEFSKDTIQLMLLLQELVEFSRRIMSMALFQLWPII